MLILAILFSFLTLTALIFQGMGLWYTYQFFQRSLITDPEICHPVSILIPVRGLDQGAFENWISFCQQDYPDYTVWFGVMDTDDPAIPVIEKVLDRFPQRAHLLTDLPPRGINYQISNLSYLVEASQKKGAHTAATGQDIVIFADSDIRVTPDYLKQVTCPLANETIGLVTCAYVDHRPRYLGAALAALGRSLDFIPSMLIARQLDQGLKFALGPTIALRRSVLEEFGGLDDVLNRIGSDFHLGQLTVKSGYRVELSRYLLDNDCGEETPADIFYRELRWSRTIRWNRGADYYGLVFTHGLVYGSVVLLLSLFAPWTNWGIAIAIISWGFRFLQSYLILSTLKLPQLHRWLWALPLRDLMSFWVWLQGCYGQEVLWRGRRLTVSGKGVLHEKKTTTS